MLRDIDQHHPRLRLRRSLPSSAEEGNNATENFVQKQRNYKTAEAAGRTVPPREGDSRRNEATGRGAFTHHVYVCVSL